PPPPPSPLLPYTTLFRSDIRHTLDMTLAMARLVDGHDRSCAPADRLGARRAVMGILVALLHDAGYLKRSSEAQVENGAIFTKVQDRKSTRLNSSHVAISY